MDIHVHVHLRVSNHVNDILYTPYISRSFYFREFRESGAIREFINTRKYLPPIPTHECDLCTQYIALLDREFNHSRKCLKVPIREKLDSRNIWRIQYIHVHTHIISLPAIWDKILCANNVFNNLQLK